MPVNRDAKLMTMMTVRATNDDDDARLGEIAAEGGSADADGAYFAFVRRAGRLLAAVDAAGVVQAYGGTVPVGHQAGGTVTMVTDLFVAAAARGAGTGRLLLDQLLPDRHRVMTSSSAHPAALPVYRRAGLVPRGTVRYLRGVAEGGGPPPVAIVPARWAHGRADLVAHFAGCGSIVTSHAVLRMPAQPGDPVVIQRVVDGGARVLAAVLRALPAGVEVECCVPSTHPAAAWCLGHGFVQSDEDVWCTTDGVLPDAGLAVVHPGLW
ncbi:MAG: hypothetical protein M9961_04285 [Ilumatobacteraceae bacterium]|nr:hypothetical protein [Ilumatobacteraceae bacterium]